MEELPKTVYLDVVGCPENRYDAAQLHAFLTSLGVRFTTNPAEADTLIVDTCGLTQGTEKLSLSIIKKLQQIAPQHRRLLITGCLPRINPHALEAFPKAQVLPGSLTDSSSCPFGSASNPQLTVSPLLHPQRITVGQRKTLSFKKGVFTNLDRLLYRWISICPPAPRPYCIKIATGCNMHCTFCAVRISRGRLRSKPPEWVINQVRKGLDAGYREFSLIGTNVSAYGRDLGTTFPRLLQTLINLDDSFRLRIRNLEPWEAVRQTDVFRELVETGRISYLEFPLETGSNRLLQLMKRGYTVDQFVHCFSQIKRACPRLLVRSQAMVGFPTETDEDFQQTLSLALQLPFDYLELYRFSPRPATKAALMEQQVDRALAKHRYETLRRKVIRSHLSHKLKLALTHCLVPLLFSKRPRHVPDHTQH